MVVARAQVQRGERAIFKPCGQSGIATEQRCCAVLVAFGLKNLVCNDCPALADCTIDRTDKGRISQRSRARLEGSGEESIEALETADIGVRSLGHVHPVALDKPAHDRSGDQSPAATGNPSAKHRQRPFGKQVLHQNGRSFRHRDDLVGQEQVKGREL